MKQSLVRLFVILMVVTLAGGCATLTGGDRDESDQPWNQPQPWEGSPHIPGLERY